MRKTASRRRQNATDRVLEWIRKHIEAHGLAQGDALPKEIEIARATRTGRSTVREALTALKVLGIIASRKKGGIRIVRDPVLLGIRNYFTDRYTSRKQFIDALHFRCIMEWGIASMVFSNISAKEIASLREIIEEVRTAAMETVDLNATEKRFHVTMTTASNNNLAKMLAHLYVPVFDTQDGMLGESESPKEWIRMHEPLVEAIEKKDRDRFLKWMEKHVGQYGKISVHHWMERRRWEAYHRGKV